jgi:cytochrome d ubiquinol oxidase subunit II
LIVLSAVAGSATLWLLWIRRFSLARLAAVLAVSSVISGWGVAQYPWLLVDEVTIADAAGAPATMRALLIAVGLAGVVVVPPLVYLLRLTQSEEWSRH